MLISSTFDFDFELLSCLRRWLWWRELVSLPPPLCFSLERFFFLLAASSSSLELSEPELAERDRLLAWRSRW
jgi:hypothetical protein